jgi:hypothetical protein
MRQRQTGMMRRVLAALVLAGAGVPAAPIAAQAQNAAAMSCGALWQERNSIYARNGYCFQTPRAVSIFGRGCFPPYGKLSGWEADRVNELQYWEKSRGC